MLLKNENKSSNYDSEKFFSFSWKISFSLDVLKTLSSQQKKGNKDIMQFSVFTGGLAINLEMNWHFFSY